MSPQSVALAVAGAGLRYAPDSIAGGFLEESVKQVSHMAANVVRESPEQAFTRWAWKTVSKLRLHACDAEDAAVCAGAVRGEAAALSRALDFDLSERAEDLVKGVCQAKNPLACCVALQTTQIGHVVPEICNRGFAHLRTLALSGRYDHVMECLLNITPLFLDCPESLLESGHFMAVVQNVLSADQTLFKTAKDLVVTHFPGPVSEEFSLMLQKQLGQFGRYGLEDESKIVLLWLNVMTALPNWFRDKNVLFVVNLLCRVAFYKTPVGRCVKECLTDLNNILQNKSCGGFMSWLSSGKGLNSLLPASLPDCPYFAFFVLEIEEECESAVKFWRALVEELREEEATLEAGVKAAAGRLKMGVPNSNHLSIYRWCQQLVDTPSDSQGSNSIDISFFSPTVCPRNCPH